MSDARADAATEDEVVDEIDGVPVLDGDEASQWLPVVSDGDGPLPVGAPAPATALELAAARPLQTAAVAAGGFVAGVAVVSLVKRRRRRRALRRGNAGRRRARRGANAGPVGELVQIVGSRSVLVDVHLLGGRD